MRKVLVLSLLILAFATAGHAQTVYQKDRWGARLLFLQENTVRAQDRWGEQLLWYDESSGVIRQKDRWGQPLLYMDGQTVRQKDRWGAPLLYFDGNTIRQKDRWGATLLLRRPNPPYQRPLGRCRLLLRLHPQSVAVGQHYTSVTDFQAFLPTSNYAPKRQARHPFDRSSHRWFSGHWEAD